jgi:hypothetical protein
MRLPELEYSEIAAALICAETNRLVCCATENRFSEGEDSDSFSVGECYSADYQLAQWRNNGKPEAGRQKELTVLAFTGSAPACRTDQERQTGFADFAPPNSSC